MVRHLCTRVRYDRCGPIRGKKARRVDGWRGAESDALNLVHLWLVLATLVPYRGNSPIRNRFLLGP